MEAAECGAAALAIILAYHQRIVPLEQLREECGVSRDGSKALNIIETARRHGLIAKGWKYDIPKLRKARLPAIVFWNFNHFLVVERFGAGGRVYLNDPASGPRSVSAEEFDAAYTGVALTFEPGPEFQKTGAKRSLLPSLLRRLKGLETASGFALLCGLFLVIPGLVIPSFSRIFIDDYLIGSERSWLRPLLAGMTVTLIVQTVLSFLQSYCLLRLEVRIALQSAGHFFQHVIRLPMKYFAQRFAGEINSRVALNDQVARLLGGQFLKIVLDLAMAAFFAALMAFYDWRLAALVVGFALLNVVLLRLVARSRADASQRVLAEQGKAAGMAINGIAMIETLKATGSEDDFFSRWAGYHTNALRAAQEIGRTSILTNSAPTLLNALSTASILAFGGFRIMEGELTVGTLVAFQALAISFAAPITSLASFGASLQTLSGSMKRIDDVIEQPEDPRYHVSTTSAADGPRRLSGGLELRNVSFGYAPLDPPLIENFSLVLEPGRRIALMGRSGSGKSTVIKLATGLFQPWAGEVLFDGKPLEQIPRSVFAGSVGVVDQEILLFEGTVRDNLTLWDPTVPEADLLEACRDAEILDIIMQRPGGFSSTVEEWGANFSGGQRQRLEFARALVHRPALLVLDEASSALDAATEALIDKRVRRRGCACLIAAHRVSTIRDADEIIVLEQGKILQRGTWDELVAQGGRFRELIEE